MYHMYNMCIRALAYTSNQLIKLLQKVLSSQKSKYMVGFNINYLYVSAKTNGERPINHHLIQDITGKLHALSASP